MNVAFNSIERVLDELCERLARLTLLHARPKTEFTSDPYLRDIDVSTSPFRLGRLSKYPASSTNRRWSDIWVSARHTCRNWNEQTKNSLYKTVTRC